MRIGCNGSTVAWVFYSRAPAGHPVFVDIWRRITPINRGFQPGRYQLIGSNEVRPQWTGLNAVVIADPRNQIAVREDDVIGFHYSDSPVTPSGHLVIPTATGSQPGPFSPNQLSMTYTVKRSSIAAGDIVDLDFEGTRSYQLPALQALVSQN